MIIQATILVMATVFSLIFIVNLIKGKNMYPWSRIWIRLITF